MRIRLVCSTCFQSDDEAVSASAPKHGSLLAISDDDIYETNCELGHRSFTVLQNPRFELLFDAGALALRDFYHREAVASCTGALEEFYAFYVRTVLRVHAVDPSTIKQFGKDTRLSERRLGAMHLAYVLENKAPFTMDKQNRRTFRNNVIHDGYWPSAAEARDYAAYVYDTISALGRQLRERHEEAFRAEMIAPVFGAHMEARRRAKENADTRSSTMAIATFLNFSLAGGARSFEEAYARWDDHNVWDLAKLATNTGLDAIASSGTPPSTE